MVQVLESYPDVKFICVDVANAYHENFGDRSLKLPMMMNLKRFTRSFLDGSSVIAIKTPIRRRIIEDGDPQYGT